MADYSTHDESVGGKGLIIAVVLIGAFILGVAFLGSSGSADLNSGAAPVAEESQVAPATE